MVIGITRQLLQLKLVYDVILPKLTKFFFFFFSELIHNNLAMQQ